MKKYINDDGEVGVLVSPFHSLGWTMDTDWENSPVARAKLEFYCMDRGLLELFFRTAEPAEILAYCAKRGFPRESVMGWWDWGDTPARMYKEICVAWLKKGTKFALHCYDGAESLFIDKDEKNYGEDEEKVSNTLGATLEYNTRLVLSFDERGDEFHTTFIDSEGCECTEMWPVFVV